MTTGQTFLNSSGVETLTISTQALDKIGEHADLHPTRALASVLFGNSRELSVGEMRRRGFTPGPTRRLLRGERVCYFRFQVFGQDLMAVVCQGEGNGEFIWETTHAPGATHAPGKVDAPETGEKDESGELAVAS
jgi:hypothetical protein